MQKTLLTLLIVICLSRFNFAEVARYDNYRIYGFTVKSAEQIELVRGLEGSSDSLIFLLKPTQVSGDVSIVVAPHKLAEFEDILTRHGIVWKVLETNLQQQIDAEAKIIRTRNRRSGFDVDSYNTIDEIYNWLRGLEKKHPNIVTVINAGKSYEGRELLGVKLSRGKNNSAVFVESGIHPREWIAPATAVFLINELLSSQEEDVKQLTMHYDWHIIPSVNPDGYVYSHAKDRLWRKTRQPYGQYCFGADANRNWDYHWNGNQDDEPPCADMYPGPKAFSEPETAAIAKYAKGLGDKLKMYLSFHSFSQLILFPNGYSEEQVQNHKDLQDIGNYAAKALARRYGTEYQVGNIYHTIYPAFGSSTDWAYGALGVPLSFCYELRPNQSASSAGFELPAKDIRPVGLETVDSLVAMFKRAEELGYLSHK